jgi:hypothetical protein
VHTRAFCRSAILGFDQNSLVGVPKVAENENIQTVGVEDILPVRSRISWSAILAGAIVALATMLILGLLGSAIGLTVREDVEGDTLSAGAALWGLISTIVAMFLAGWITCLCAVGETKREAVVHGIITWGVVLAMGVWLVASGVGAGMSAVAGLAQAGAAASDKVDWTTAARRAGVTEEQLNQWRQSTQNAPTEATAVVRDPENQRRAAAAATNATWWALAGTILSLAAAIIGAIVGAGPNFTLLREPAGTGYVVRENRYRAAQ